MSLTEMEPGGPGGPGGPGILSYPLPNPERIIVFAVVRKTVGPSVVIGVLCNGSYSGYKLGLGWPHHQTHPQQALVPLVDQEAQEVPPDIV